MAYRINPEDYLNPNKKIVEQYGKTYNPQNTWDMYGIQGSGKNYDLAKDQYAKNYDMYTRASQYGQVEGGLADEESRRRQEAYLLNERMLKYLPQQLSRMGLGTQGIAQSAKIQMGNNLSNQFGSIGQDVGRRKQDLYNAYLGDMGAMRKETDASQKEIIDTYLAQEQAYDEENKPLAQVLIDNAKTKQEALDAIGVYNFSETTKKALQDYINQLEQTTKKDTWKQTTAQSTNDTNFPSAWNNQFTDPSVLYEGENKSSGFGSHFRDRMEETKKARDDPFGWNKQKKEEETAKYAEERAEQARQRAKEKRESK
jgi:hypothetical protein